MDKSYRPQTILRMMLEFKQFFAWRLHMLTYRGFAPNLEAYLAGNEGLTRERFLEIGKMAHNFIVTNEPLGPTPLATHETKRPVDAKPRAVMLVPEGTYYLYPKTVKGYSPFIQSWLDLVERWDDYLKHEDDPIEDRDEWDWM